MYHFFGSSPRSWEFFKEDFPFSLHAASKTRWATRMNAVKPAAKYLSTIRAEVEEAGLLHLQTHTCAELQYIKKCLDTFEYITFISYVDSNFNLIARKIVYPSRLAISMQI
jgi:hypothetical protein